MIMLAVAPAPGRGNRIFAETCVSPILKGDKNYGSAAVVINWRT